jgi:uncharacterized protein YprB with RNaseH-like and TPR domain
MALSESRRKKLAMLTRSIARGDFDSAGELLRAHGHSGVNRGKAAPEPLTLAEACPGVETPVSDVDKRIYYLIRRTLAEIAEGELAVESEYAAVMRGARERFDELTATPALCHAADARPEDLLFMDTETCGLSGAMIFLVGLMSFHDGQLVFEQCFARDYAEEAAILQRYADRYAEAGVLVTFNGKAFDMNLIRERSAFHGVELPERDPPHLDLLHEFRRRFKGRVPNCRLQTLEHLLCGRARHGDIPGAEIPDAYHGFVSDGDARAVRDILHHNLLDLLTMAQLVCILLTGSDPLT